MPATYTAPGCDRTGCGHSAALHDTAHSACKHCGCPGYVPPTARRDEPSPPPEEDEIEQYLNEADPMPPLAAGFVSMIEAGHLDRYLELILNAAHNRKRTLRGTPGFPRARWRR